MTQPNLTPEQETQLEQALEKAQQFEQNLQELNELGEAFAQKWENKLTDAATTVAKLKTKETKKAREVSAIKDIVDADIID